MGREIKFRAKRKDDVWVYGSLVVGTDGETMYIFTSEGAQWNVFSETVGQYTGLKDKYGREIYEWDIVDDDQEPMKVEYQEGSFGLKFLNNIKYFDNCINWDCCEIIGNIYENPELLEV